MTIALIDGVKEGLTNCRYRAADGIEKVSLPLHSASISHVERIKGTDMLHIYILRSLLKYRVRVYWPLEMFGSAHALTGRCRCARGQQVAPLSTESSSNRNVRYKPRHVRSQKRERHTEREKKRNQRRRTRLHHNSR